MTQQSDVDSSPFFLEGGPIGVLLIHGFTGSPPEMRMVGDYLHQRGLSVSGPRLPGHGTSLEDLNRRRWTEWTYYVEGALADLHPRSAQFTFEGAGSKDKELVTLHKSGHVLTVDGEWESVAEKTYRFIQRICGGKFAGAECQ
jgi:esterase/lipase